MDYENYLPVNFKYDEYILLVDSDLFTTVLQVREKPKNQLVNRQLY